MLNVIVSDLKLKFVDEKILGNRGIFRVDTTGASSCSDHFAVSSSLFDAIGDVAIIDSGINLSDHCPVIMSVYIVITLSGNGEC